MYIDLQVILCVCYLVGKSEVKRKSIGRIGFNLSISFFYSRDARRAALSRIRSYFSATTFITNLWSALACL